MHVVGNYELQQVNHRIGRKACLFWNSFKRINVGLTTEVPAYTKLEKACNLHIEENINTEMVKLKCSFSKEWEEKKGERN